MASSTPRHRGHDLPTLSFGLITALCYAIAFASLLLQWPALVGQHGLEPASLALKLKGRIGSTYWDTFLTKVPSVLVFHDWVGLSLDVAAEAVCVLGLVLALLQLRLTRPHPLVFGALFLLYHSVFALGGTFLSFQWDLLLLEVGFAAMLLFPLGASRGRNPAAMWLLRFALFKLMLMAGVVKLQSGCPSWAALSATEVHFASQCIPTPLAWYLHNSPPLLHRLYVASTLWLEIPATLLLLSPFAMLLKWGVALQVVLQLIILSSGNYTFFNLATIGLAIACWPTSNSTAPPPPIPLQANGTPSPLALLQPPTATKQSGGLSVSAFTRAILFTLQVAVLLVGTSYSLWFMFAFVRTECSRSRPDCPWWLLFDIHLTPRMDVTPLNALLDDVLPWCVRWVALCILVTGSGFLFREVLRPSTAAGAAALQWFVSACAACCRGVCCCGCCCCARPLCSSMWRRCGAPVVGRCSRVCRGRPATATAAAAAATGTASEPNGAHTEASSPESTLFTRHRQHQQQQQPRHQQRQWWHLLVSSCAALLTIAGMAWAVLSCVAVCGTFVLSATMLLSLHGKPLLAEDVVFPAPLLMFAHYAAVQSPWRVSSGYGLFRAMTGMGPISLDAWGERMLSTERPELELQGLWLEDARGECAQYSSSIADADDTDEDACAASPSCAGGKCSTDSIDGGGVGTDVCRQLQRGIECAPLPHGAEYVSSDAALIGRTLAATTSSSSDSAAADTAAQGRWVWRPLHLPFKPGDIWCAPPIVAPHQPRVDWQMWFAALAPPGPTSPNFAPWLVNWADALLNADSPLPFSLLDVDAYPVKRWVSVSVGEQQQQGNQSSNGDGGGTPASTFHLYLVPPSAIRIVRYVYDFTRAQSVPWGRPRHTAFSSVSPGFDTAVVDAAKAGPHSSPWWQRALAPQEGSTGGGRGSPPMWLPPITRRNKEVAAFLERQSLRAPPSTSTSKGKKGGAKTTPRPRRTAEDREASFIAAGIARTAGTEGWRRRHGGSSASSLLHVEVVATATRGDRSSSSGSSSSNVSSSAPVHTLPALLRAGPGLDCSDVGRRAVEWGVTHELGSWRSRRGGSAKHALLVHTEKTIAWLSARRDLLSARYGAAVGAAVAHPIGTAQHALNSLFSLVKRPPQLPTVVRSVLVAIDGVVEDAIVLGTIVQLDTDSASRALVAEVLLPGIGRTACACVRSWRAMGLASPALSGHVLDVKPHDGSSSSAPSTGAADGSSFSGRLVFVPSSVHHAPALWSVVGIAALGVIARIASHFGPWWA